jgi:hypothetical protein
MKKLEEIPKKDIYDVPEGYFETLPGVVHARVRDSANNKAFPVFANALKYAMAASIIAIAAIFWFRKSPSPESPEAMLARVETADLVAYLNDSELTTDELMDDVALLPEHADSIENEVYNFDLIRDNVSDVLDELE